MGKVPRVVGAALREEGNESRGGDEGGGGMISLREEGAAARVEASLAKDD